MRKNPHPLHIPLRYKRNNAFVGELKTVYYDLILSLHIPRNV